MPGGRRGSRDAHTDLGGVRLRGVAEQRGIPDAEVAPLIAHASHFHARGARKGRLQARFKENTIDYARIVRAMKETGYRGYIGIEYVWTDWEHCNEVDNLSETILLRDFIRKAWTEARAT